MDINNPDASITASDLEAFVLEYLTALPIQGCLLPTSQYRSYPASHALTEVICI
jgi:hypothetical protein